MTNANRPTTHNQLWPELNPDLPYEALVEWVKSTLVTAPESFEERLPLNRWDKLTTETAMADRAILDNSLPRELSPEEIMNYWRWVFLGNYAKLSGSTDHATLQTIELGSKARDILFRRLLPTVRIVLNVFHKKYLKDHPRESLELLRNELFQDGSVALIKALDSYDPRTGSLITTYVSKQIEVAMLNGLHRETLTGTVTDYFRKQFFKCSTMRSLLREILNQEPNYREIAIAIALGKDAVKAWISQGRDLEQADVAFAPALTPERVEDYLTFGIAQIQLDQPINPEEDTLWSEVVTDQKLDRLNHFEREMLTQYLEQIIAYFPWRERYVLVNHYGLFGHSRKELKDIADQLNISYERVRQLHHSAISILQRDPKADELKDFWID